MWHGKKRLFWAWLSLLFLLSALVPATAAEDRPYTISSQELTALRQISAGLRDENARLLTELESSRGNSDQLSRMLDSFAEKIGGYEARLMVLEEKLGKSRSLATEASQALTEAEASLTSSIQSLTKLRDALLQAEIDGWIRTICAAAIALGFGWALGHFL